LDGKFDHHQALQEWRSALEQLTQDRTRNGRMEAHVSRGSPISLSSHQLALMMIAAEQMRNGEARSRFLSAIADELTDREINDSTVADAVSKALEKFACASEPRGVMWTLYTGTAAPRTS
jgi:hypothetical protein